MSYFGGCILLRVLTDVERGYYEDWWLVLAFIIGLVIGMVVAFVCLRMCINSWIKKRLGPAATQKQRDDKDSCFQEQVVPCPIPTPSFLKGTTLGRFCFGYYGQQLRQDEEEQANYVRMEERKKQKELKQRFGLEKKSIRKSLKKRLKPTKRGSKRGDGDGSEESGYISNTILTALEMDNLETIQAGDGVEGLMDAAIQTTEEAGENELLKKDVASTTTSETIVRQQRVIALAELCRLYLNKLARAGRLDEASYEGLVEFIHKSSHELQGRAEAELQVIEDEIRNDPELQKNQILMNKRLSEIPSKQNSILTSLLAEEQIRLVRRLAHDSKLSDEETEALLSSLATDMSNWERILGEQQFRNCEKLEERLARRRELVAVAQGQQEQARDDVEAQIVSKEAQLEWVAENASNALSEKQRQEILESYRADLFRVHEAHEANVLEQQKKLNEKLRQHRENRLKDLSKKQILKDQDFFRRVDQVTETEDFVKAYGALIEQQTDAREAVIAELDQNEIQALMEVRKNLEHERQSKLNDLEEQFLQRLRNEGGINHDQADRLIGIHEKEVNEFKRIRKMERRMQTSKLAERLAERRQMFEDDQRRSEIEDKALKDQQTTTLQKTLNLQMELPDDAKERIMKDHEQNVNALTNQLALSRNRQRKETEQRMAERRAKVAALKRQKEDERLVRRGERAKELERVEKELDIKIARAEKEVADARAQEMDEMRERLAKETEEALKAQEEQMSAVIARMQVGQARRQNIIAKQNKMIEELETQLEKKLAESDRLTEGDPAMRGLDQLLQTHFNQVSNLSDQLQDDRQRQESVLAEKLKRKRMKKEQALETQIDTESGQEIDRMERAGLTRIGQLLMESAMENKHKSALNDLEKEMMVEFQREKEEMNRQLEKELEEALAEQQKNFLAQLASVASLDEEEVSKVAAAAAKESGVGGKEAKRFTRDFKDSFRRRSSSVYGDDVQYGGSSGGNDLESGDYPGSEPKRDSKRSKRKKRHKNSGEMNEFNEDF